MLYAVERYHNKISLETRPLVIDVQIQIKILDAICGNEGLADHNHDIRTRIKIWVRSAWKQHWYVPEIKLSRQLPGNGRLNCSNGTNEFQFQKAFDFVESTAGLVKHEHRLSKTKYLSLINISGKIPHSIDPFGNIERSLTYIFKNPPQ